MARYIQDRDGKMRGRIGDGITPPADRKVRVAMTSEQVEAVVSLAGVLDEVRGEWDYTPPMTKAGTPVKSVPNPFAARMAGVSCGVTQTVLGDRRTVEVATWREHLDSRRRSGADRYEARSMVDVVLAATFDAEAVRSGRYRVSGDVSARDLLLLGLRSDDGVVVPVGVDDFVAAPSDVQMMVARDPNTDPDVLTALAGGDGLATATAVNMASNPATPAQALGVLEARSVAQVRAKVAVHPNTPVAVLERMLDDESDSVAVKVLGNDRTPVTVEALALLSTRPALRNVVRARARVLAESDPDGEQRALAFFLVASLT